MGHSATPKGRSRVGTPYCSHDCWASGAMVSAAGRRRACLEPERSEGRARREAVARRRGCCGSKVWGRFFWSGGSVEAQGDARPDGSEARDVKLQAVRGASAGGRTGAVRSDSKGRAARRANGRVTDEAEGEERVAAWLADWVVKGLRISHCQFCKLPANPGRAHGAAKSHALARRPPITSGPRHRLYNEHFTAVQCMSSRQRPSYW